MLSFLTPNMAAVTSLANQQYYFCEEGNNFLPINDALHTNSELNIRFRGRCLEPKKAKKYVAHLETSLRGFLNVPYENHLFQLLMRPEAARGNVLNPTNVRTAVSGSTTQDKRT